MHAPKPEEADWKTQPGRQCVFRFTIEHVKGVPKETDTCVSTLVAISAKHVAEITEEIMDVCGTVPLTKDGTTLDTVIDGSIKCAQNMFTDRMTKLQKLYAASPVDVTTISATESHPVVKEMISSNAYAVKNANMCSLWASETMRYDRERFGKMQPVGVYTEAAGKCMKTKLDVSSHVPEANKQEVVSIAKEMTAHYHEIVSLTDASEPITWKQVAQYTAVATGAYAVARSSPGRKVIGAVVNFVSSQRSRVWGWIKSAGKQVAVIALANGGCRIATYFGMPLPDAQAAMGDLIATGQIDGQTSHNIVSRWFARNIWGTAGSDPTTTPGCDPTSTPGSDPTTVPVHNPLIIPKRAPEPNNKPSPPPSPASKPRLVPRPVKQNVKQPAMPAGMITRSKARLNQL